MNDSSWELTSSAIKRGYAISWDGVEVGRVQFHDEPLDGNTIEAWNTGTIMYTKFCRWYPKAAKKLRVRKKWIKRFGALYYKVSPGDLYA